MLKTLAVLLSLCGAAFAADDNSWHLLTQSYGGTISLLKGLSEHECEFARARAKGEPATDEEKIAAKRADEARASAAEKACIDQPDGYVVVNSWSMTVECKDGHRYSYSWSSGGGYVDAGAIVRAECFQ